MMLAAAEVPGKPAVDRAEGKLTAPRALTRTGYVLQQPREFRRRKIRVKQQPGAAGDVRLVTGGAQLRAMFSRAAVLPHDRARHRLAGVAIPKHRRFALVCNADRDNIRRRG